MKVDAKGTVQSFKEEVEATRMPMAAPFVLSDGVTGPTRMQVQKAFDKEKGLLRVRINNTEKGLKIRDLKVDAKGTVQSFKEEVELDEMKWAVGGVYHQEYKNGDKTYFRADSVQKNKRWKGLSVDEFGGRQKKAKNASADEKQQGWETTPKNEIPKGLKEEVEVDEAKMINVKLPAHLAKFFDKKGNPKPEVAARIRKARALKGVKITDVTPDWMFEGGFQEISNLVDITQEVMGKMIKAMKKDDFRTVTKLYKELGNIIK